MTVVVCAQQRTPLQLVPQLRLRRLQVLCVVLAGRDGGLPGARTVAGVAMFPAAHGRGVGGGGAPHNDLEYEPLLAAFLGGPPA